MRQMMIAALALAAAPAWADLPQGEWKTARPITIEWTQADPDMVYLPLDDAALAAESLSEYRIVRDGRDEVPYRMVAEKGHTETDLLPTTVISKATLGKKKAEVVVDRGAAPVSANQLELRLRGGNFRCRVRVEGSADQRRWWLLTDDGLVYRHEGRFEQTRVTTPPHQYRYLRITLSRLERALPKVEAAQVIREITIPRKVVPVPAKMARREDAKKRQTIIVLDLGRPGRDLAEVQFEVEEPAFDRPVTVEAALSGADYEWQASDRLERLAADRAAVLPLQIARARRLRITMDNGDDRPLTIRGVTLRRVRRGLVFSGDPGGKYELWYGRPDAPRPVYDIQRLPMVEPLSQLSGATLGPERKLPVKPPPPPPWSERHPALLWIALAVVVILLAALILRAMRVAGRAAPSG